MFGYVRIYKPEMKIKEYDTYKAIYCSLCKQLGKKYGILSRLTLSYDFTFLALLEMALKEDCPQFVQGRCTFNPLKKCNYCKDTLNFDMSCAAAMIMLYYKVLDNIADEKGIKKLFFLLCRTIFKRPYKKAARQFTNIEKIVSEYIGEQNKLENENNQILDLAAQPTANAMAKILALCSDDENQKRILERIGYCLGRYIYILDAACDYEQDLKSGSYNCLKFDKEFSKEDIFSKLYFCINEATLAFELLDLKKFKPILVNILYVGLEETFKKELNK
ncbi:MAG: hypothetical protein IJP22_04595 [Clostridia bacterium]|nr:hypothetical protein [Clostridia bacterium]